MFSPLSILYRFFGEISEQPFIIRRNFPGLPVLSHKSLSRSATLFPLSRTGESLAKQVYCEEKNVSGVRCLCERERAYLCKTLRNWLPSIFSSSALLCPAYRPPC